MRLGGPQGRSGRVRQVSPPTNGIPLPDRPANSESLYRLSYPGPSWMLYRWNKLIARPGIELQYPNYPVRSVVYITRAIQALFFRPGLIPPDSRLQSCCPGLIPPDCRPQSCCPSLIPPNSRPQSCCPSLIPPNSRPQSCCPSLIPPNSRPQSCFPPGIQLFN